MERSEPSRGRASRHRCQFPGSEIRPSVLIPLILLWIGNLSGQSPAAVVIISGLGGMPEYEENFVAWSDKLEALFKDRLPDNVYRYDGRQQRAAEILEGLKAIPATISEEGEVWIFLVGHGNHDGERYRLHIKGPDITDQDLAGLLAALGERRVFLIAGSSASGALLPILSGENRVVVTATRNARERRPPLFLSFFLEAAESPVADTNKNGRVSLLEAFVFAKDRVAEWFTEKGRIQTEHPVLNDQAQFVLGADARGGDDPLPEPDLRTGSGLLAAAAYLAAPPERAYRSLEAQELARQRATLEREIEDLKFRKAEVPTDDYYRQLEQLLIKLAQLNSRIEELESSR